MTTRSNALSLLLLTVLVGWSVAAAAAEPAPAGPPTGTVVLDSKTGYQLKSQPMKSVKITANEPDAKAILPEARSVQKAISYQ